MRLFVAIDLPAETKLRVAAALAPLRATLPRARWVRPERFHLTLAFLGETGTELQSRVVRRLGEKLEQGERFAGKFASLGTFPSAGLVRVLWIGFEPRRCFERLASFVREGIAAAGGHFDAKPCRPHLTIARCAPPWPSVARESIVAESRSFTELLSSLELSCDRVTLFSSLPRSGGPAHRVEADFQLRPASAGSAGPDA